jgi:hypothetical protein
MLVLWLCAGCGTSSNPDNMVSVAEDDPDMLAAIATTQQASRLLVRLRAAGGG